MFGVRKPSLKKSFSARTKGRATRSLKRAVIPGYGKKGRGWLTNSKKAAYNNVYNKTTISLSSALNNKTKTKTKTSKKSNIQQNKYYQNYPYPICPKCAGLYITATRIAANLPIFMVCQNCGYNWYVNTF